MMTSTDAAQLKEQSKEFELLQEKLKTSHDSASKNKKQQPIEGDVLKNENDENLFKTTDDEFEREWQSVFTSTASNLSETKLSNNDNVDDLLSPTHTSNSFFKTFLPSQLLTTKPSINAPNEQSILQPQSLVPPQNKINQQLVNKNQKVRILVS